MRYKSLPYSVRSQTPDPIAPPVASARSAPRPRRLRDVLATLPIVLLIPALVLPFVIAEASVGGRMIASPAELAVLPTTGTAWTSMKAIADGSLGSADLTDQDNRHSVKTLGVALVANRLDSDIYRAKARAAILSAIGTERVGAENSILSLGRQLGAYVLAADLIGLSGTEDATFRSWLSSIRTRNLGGHSRWYTLRETAIDSSNNWGTFALASLTAADAYLGDTVALDRDWRIFDGYGDGSWPFGRSSSYQATWACPEGFAINPASCTDLRKQGAAVEDASRTTFPTIGGYPAETAQGFVFTAELLARAGRPAWTVNNAQVCRHALWRQRLGNLNYSSADRYVTWITNARCGHSQPTVAAGFGRVFGYTDWLYGSPLSGTVPVPTATRAPAPTPVPTATPRPTAAPPATPVPTATSRPSATATSVPTTSPMPSATGSAPSTVPSASAAPTSAAPTAAATPAPTASPAPTAAPTEAPPAADTLRRVDSAKVDIRSTSVGANGTATSVVIDRPAGARAGDQLIAAIGVRGAPTIQAPSGWKLVGIEVNGTITTLATYTRVAGSSEPASYTWKFSASQAASGAIVALRGSGSSLSEAAGRVNAKASDIVGPATDISANRSLVLGFFAAARSTSISAPAGMTELGEAASTAGTYKVTLEVSAGSANVGRIGPFAARASGSSASAVQLVVFGP